MVYIFVRQTTKGGSVLSSQSTNLADNYNTISIPLGDLTKTGVLTIGSSQQLSINGQLKVNNSLVMTPTTRPTNPVTGQIYFDQTSNQLNYFNGADFVTVPNSQFTVTSVGGATGVVALGTGLVRNGAQISNSGVLSVQGQTGAVALTAGDGIAINGTTISSTAVQSIGGKNGAITLGTGLAFTGTTLSNSGVISATAGSGITIVNDGTGNITISNSGGSSVTSPGGIAGYIAKFTGVQTVADSLLSESGSQITVGGTLSVVSNQATATMIFVNNTNLGATGNLIDLQANSISRFHVTPTGDLTLSGSINSQAVSSNTSLTGSLTVTGLSSLNGGANVTGTLTANTITPTGTMTVGSTGQTLTLQGGAGTTLSATNAGNTTAIIFQTPTANVNYRFLTTTAGTYDVCTTAGNCTGSGNTVTTAGGTINAIPKFTGAQVIGNSIITDNGTTVTIGGALAVNTITPSAGMTLGATSQTLTLQGTTTTITATNTGVTNSLVFATPSGLNKTITIPNTTGTVVVSASAPLSIDAAGNISCPSCLTGASGVSSLDGLTGALTIANSSGAGSTVTINDATTASKGIASFNSTNFSVTGGVVNTIQDIAVASTPTFGRLTVTSSQATNGMFLVNNTNAAASGNLLDLQTNSVSQFHVSPAGALTLLGTVNGQTISSSASFTGTLGVTGLASLNGGATVTGTLTANTITPTAALTVGATTQSFLVQGNASSTITATSGLNVTTLSFQAPTASVTYRLLTAAAGTYDVCTTVGNCAGVGGGVTTPGGTANTVAKFTAGGVIGNSIITDNGTTVTIGGTLAVNTITPGAAMTIGATTQNITIQGATTQLTATSAGITNTLTFATPSTAGKTITVPNATGTVAVSASGPLALDAAGNLTCPTCLTSGGGGGTAGVSSLDGLTGALTLANSTGTGTTVTINDATTAAKGIASYNSTNFTVTSGAVNTIQDISTAATPTFGRLTVSSSQATSGMMLINNTNATGSGNLLDVQLNSANRLSVSSAGAMTLVGALNGQTISSAASFTGTLGVTGLASLNGGATVTGTLTANTITPTAALTVGATTQSFLVQGSSGSTIAAVSGANSTTLSFQAPTAAVTYRFLTAAAGTYDICTTVGNCAGVGGGVTTPGGTANTVAKFTAGGVIGNSIITDNGTTVAIGGTLAVNTLTPTAALTVGATTQNLTLQGATVNLTSTATGVTNTLTFATPTTAGKTITIPDASGTLVVSASAPLSISATGNITCPSCVTSAVTSLNSLTGALTIANASGVGGTITINDATTAAKGIASFNSTNFTVAAGAVNTIQNINTAATPTFNALTLTGANAGLTVNSTSGSPNLINLQNSLATRFLVTSAGAITLLGGLSPDITSMASLGSGNNITIKPAATTADLVTGAAVVIRGGDSALGDGGGVVIDAGTGGNSGINIGLTNASQVLIGNNASINTIAGTTWLNASNSANTTIGSGTGTAGTINIQGGVNSSFSVTNATGTTKLAFAAPSTTGIVTFQLPAGGTGATTYAVCTTLTVCSGYAPATGSGTYFSQGGNSFAAAGNLGTNDANVLNIRTGGVTRITVAANGANVTLASGVSLLLQGSSSISNPQATTGGEAFGLSAVVGANNALALGASSNASFAGSIAVGASATTTAANQMVIGSSSAGISQLVVGNGVTSATPVGFRLQASSGSGANIAGANMDLAAGQGTGTGVGGNISFLTAPAGTTGSALNALSTVGVISGTNGSWRLQNTANSTTGFNIQNAGGNNLFTVDTSNSRVGINLGGAVTPTLAAGGLEIGGALRLSGTITDNFVTPQGSSVSTKINIPLYDPGTFGQVMALGIPGVFNATNVDYRERVLSLFDNRTSATSNAMHQPTLAVFSPNESSMLGLNWNGSNTLGNFQTNDLVSGSTTAVMFSSGQIYGAAAAGSTGAAYFESGAIVSGSGGYTTGNVVLQSGSAAGTNSSSGNIIIDTGTATGTVGTISIGGTNSPSVSLGAGSNIARAIHIGDSGTSTAQTITVGSTSSTSTLSLQAGTGTATGDMILQTAAGGIINIGGNAVTNKVLNLGSTGTTNAASTVNIATTNANQTQAVTIGNTASANSVISINGGSSSTAVQIQTAAGGTVTTLAGAIVNKTIANSTTGFQIQNQGGTAILTGDTTNTAVNVNNAVSTNGVFNALGGVTIQSLAAPATLSITQGGTPGASTYTYKVYACDDSGAGFFGCTFTSPAITQTTTTGNATLSATNYNILNWSAVPGAKAYAIYLTAGPGVTSTNPQYLTSTSATTYNSTANTASYGVPPTTTSSGSLNAAGSGYFGNNLSVAGSASVGSFGSTATNLSVTGNSSFTGIITIAGDAYLGNAPSTLGMYGGIQVAGLSTPGTPSVTVQGASGTTTYTYYIAACSTNCGNYFVSTPQTTPVGPGGATTAGNATLTTTNYNAVSWTAVNGAAGYAVYRVNGGITYLVGFAGPGTSGYTMTYNDTGSVISSGVTMPTVDQTGNIQTKSVDTLTGTLNIGAYSATTINLGRATGTTNVTTNVNGLAMFKSNTDTHQTFGVQNASGSNLFTIDALSFNIGVGTGTQSLANLLQVGSYTTADYAGTLFVGTGTNTHKGVVIQGTATQTANLLEMQSSTGTALLAVNSAGNQVFGNDAAHSIGMLQAASGVGKNLTITAGQGATGSTGGNLYLQAGANGTAAGAPGSVIVTSNGGNSTSAFQVQRSDATAFLNVDTTSQILTVGAVNSALLAMTVNGGIDQTGYYTTDTGGTFAGQWTKLAECHITTQYQNCDTTINITGGNGPGATSNVHATVHARVKQQNAMAGVPFVQVSVDGVSEGITKNDITAVTTVNNATDTRVQLWGRINDSFETWYYTSLINGNFPGWGWSPTSGFQAALPAGTQTAATYGDTYANTVTMIPSADSTTAFKVQNAAGTTILNVDTTGGFVGVGKQTTTPWTALSVQDTQATNYVADIYNYSTSATAKGLLIQLGVADASRATTNYFVAFADATTVAGKIQGGANAVAYTTTGADYAEYFGAPAGNLPKAGELVTMDSTDGRSVVRSTSDTQRVLPGVVSTNSGFIGNGPLCKVTDDNCDKNYANYNVLVAMTGQVPTKVNATNGPINIGDPITVSSVAGEGAKATSAGFIVGYAQQALASGSGSIQVLIRPQYYTPAVSGMLQATNMTLTGTITAGGSLNVGGMATVASLTVTGNATVGGSLTVAGLTTVQDLKVNGHIVTAGGKPTVQALTAAGAGAAVAITGTDTAGTITITVGASGLTAGDLAKIAFSSAFGGQPHVQITPVGSGSAALQAYVNQTTADFTLGADSAPVAQKTYTFNYSVIQ